jgi:hypothetical protein
MLLPTIIAQRQILQPKWIEEWDDIKYENDMDIELIEMIGGVYSPIFS